MLRGLSIFVPPILAILLAMSVLVWGEESKVLTFDVTDDILYNPYTGFAPNANYPEAVGDNTLVYINLTFKKWEPEEGFFDVENVIKTHNIERWKNEGKKCVLRFVCDIPDTKPHSDIPEWLREIPDNGVEYSNSYGMGFSPNYNNERFIEEHRKAIEALGEAFGKDDFIAYIELGSLGHWGEWHVNSGQGLDKFPSEEICRQYVEPYIAAFPNATLLMRRPFSFVRDYGMGVFNDVIGSEDASRGWLNWIENGGEYTNSEEPMILPPVPNIWNNYALGGEITSQYPMSSIVTDRLDNMIALLKDSHFTFIGPNCPVAHVEQLRYPEGVSTMLKYIGYRIGIDKAIFTRNTVNNDLSLKLKIHNNGVAPFYKKWPLYVYELDEDENVIGKIETNFDITSLKGGNSAAIEVYLGKTDTISDMPDYAVGIENPITGENEILFDNPTMDKQKKILLLK